MNVQNGILNIYWCKKIYQLTYECACTSSDQKFESILDIMAECKINLELFSFIHKYIRDFDGVKNMTWIQTIFLMP